jgi:predicted phage tail protein
MLREIRVYGELAKFMGVKSFMAEARDVGEAVRYLLVNFAGLEAHMVQYDYRILVGGYSISEEEISYPIGGNIIRIIPVVAGAGGKNSAVGRILAGVAIIGLSILSAGLLSGFAYGFAGGFAGLGTFATAGVSIGASLALGGVAQMLTPVPRIAPPAAMSGYSPTYTSPTMRESEMDPQKSYSFSGIQNTSVQGTPVPIIYGETVVGSVVISANISTLEVV